MISRSKDGVYTVREVITQDRAVELLGRNTMNRPLSRGHVERLRAAQVRGEWELNGSTIKISKSGRLLDGQHRLTACVESGIPFETLVVYGLDESTFATIDVGSKIRKVSDVLAIESGVNMKNVAAALAVLHQFREQQEVSMSGDRPGGRYAFSVAVAREMLEKHPGIVDATVASNNLKIWRNAQCSALTYLFSLVDQRLSEDFIEVLRNGSSDIRRPFNLFREGLIGMRTTSQTPNKRAAAARAIKAFNAELNGRSVGLLVWRLNEEFPLIEGLDYGQI